MGQNDVYWEIFDLSYLTQIVDERYRMRMRHLLTFLMAASLAVPAVSCSDDAGSSSQDETPDNPNPPDQPDDPDLPEGPIDDPVMPEEGWKTILIPNMATDVEIANTGVSKLSVMAISIEGETSGEGVVGELIRWGIETNRESLSLGSSSSQTREGGVASVSIRGLGIPNNVTVVAQSKNAPKNVRFNVKVSDLPVGNLAVEAKYNGLAPVENYSIHIYDSKDFYCGYYDPKVGVTADALFPPVDESFAEFKGLSPTQNYTIVVNGYSAQGAKVASGCLDSGTQVFENQTTNVNVYLDTIDLSLNTTFRARSYFDLGDVANALGTVGQFVKYVTDFADDPALVLYNLLFDFIKDYVGGAGTALDWLLDNFGLKKIMIDYLNGLLIQNKTVCQVGNFACQIRNIIRTMEFMGDLEIQRAGQVELRGHNAYDGLAVYWRGGCKTDSQGNYVDPTCGRYPLSTKDLGLKENINFLEGSWSGSIANGYDKISIESHELKLEYGKIAFFLINNVVLPKLAGGAKNFPDAIAYWINCDAVGKWLANTIPKCVGLTVAGVCVGKTTNISPSQATGWCKSASNTLGSALGFLTAMGELQKANSNVAISGTALVIDTNADNVVDDIHSGRWSGSMTINTSDDAGNPVTTTTAVRGIWSAYNAENVKTGEGEDEIYCSTPKSGKDSADQVCGYPTIDINSLVSSNMCKKYIECSK